MPDLTSHYRTVAKAIMEGRVVPLLGAGVNLCGRPPDVVWNREQAQYLPSGKELVEFLAQYFEYPEQDLLDLARVSQYASVVSGLGPLYDELHEVFDADFPISSVHELLATIPQATRAAHGAPKYQLIVTTNYDDALERAFGAANEPFDLVYYVADKPKEHRGRFMHCPPAGEPRPIEKPNEYRDVSLADRTVILKIHGAIDRLDPERDNYVITEDHYIDYLTHTDIAQFVPVVLAAKLRRSHFLFLGYSMRDWNLRVILHRIWGEQELPYTSWAIQREPTVIDQKFWSKRSVEILDVDLEEYVSGLREAVHEPLGAGVG